MTRRGMVRSAVGCLLAAPVALAAPVISKDGRQTWLNEMILFCNGTDSDLWLAGPLSPSDVETLKQLKTRLQVFG